MKFILFILSLVCYTVYGFGQTVNINVNEPEWTNEILFVNIEENKTIELERQDAFSNSKVSTGAQLTGIGNVKTRIKVNGGTSPVRLVPSNGKLYFIYKAESNTQNPKDLVHLHAFKTEGKFRTILVGLANDVSKTSGALTSLNFKAEKYKTSSYLITIDNLKPGQYGFALGKEKSNTINMFSIAGGKEDIPEEGKMPIFEDFFEMKKDGLMVSNAKVQINKDPSSDDYNNEICDLLKSANIACVDEKDNPEYEIAYYYGTYLRRGPEGKCLQIQIKSTKEDKIIASISKNISSFPPPSKKKVMGHIEDFFSNLNESIQKSSQKE